MKRALIFALSTGMAASVAIGHEKHKPPVGYQKMTNQDVKIYEKNADLMAYKKHNAYFYAYNLMFYKVFRQFEGAKVDVFLRKKPEVSCQYVMKKHNPKLDITFKWVLADKGPEAPFYLERAKGASNSHCKAIEEVHNREASASLYKGIKKLKWKLNSNSNGNTEFCEHAKKARMVVVNKDGKKNLSVMLYYKNSIDDMLQSEQESLDNIIKNRHKVSKEDMQPYYKLHWDALLWANKKEREGKDSVKLMTGPGNLLIEIKD